MDYPECVKSSLEERILAGNYKSQKKEKVKPKRDPSEYFVPADDWEKDLNKAASMLDRIR